MTTQVLDRRSAASADVDDRAAAIKRLHDATAYYTSEPIVRQLLATFNWPVGGRRLVDSSCGDGAFLGAALELLLDREPHASDAQLVEQIQGWEIHYFAAAESRERIAKLLIARGRGAQRARCIATQMVTHGDFLTEGPQQPTWDCVAGNPPFLRYAHLPSILRTQYESELPDYSRGDMLHSFIDRCTLTLRAGGEIALVTSDRWLFAQCAAQLREVVGQRLGVHHLKRLDSSSAFYRPKNRRAGQPPRIHPVAVVLREAHLCEQALTRAPIYPEADDTAYAGWRKLGEVAGVRLAPWLGPEGIFVIDEPTARAAQIPSELLVPVVDTANIRGGVLTASTRFAIRTSRDHEPPEAVMRHIEANYDRMPRTKQRAAKRWLPPESFARMDLSKSSLLIPRIAASLRPVRIPAGILPLDHGISIVSAGELELDEIERALLHPDVEAWVRARAPRLENGYFSLTTTLLRELPVPPVRSARAEGDLP